MSLADLAAFGSFMTSVDVFALLQTVAQIAVAFAGFRALASGLCPRLDLDHIEATRRALQIWRLVLMHLRTSKHADTQAA